jgi:PleD family two-component response regulator
MSNANGRSAMADSFSNGKEHSMYRVSSGPSMLTEPLNLMVVDDDENIREVCRTIAKESGLKAWDVATAEEALEMLETASIDIVLADLRLPGARPQE